ncbi:hypothetical protein GGF41_008415 [Coemansia sp. RSA 2531]|nr:hypothetical protein GGF41_008415 [Coemansia sp. RSA 2531]
MYSSKLSVHMFHSCTKKSKGRNSSSPSVCGGVLGLSGVSSEDSYAELSPPSDSFPAS